MEPAFSPASLAGERLAQLRSLRSFPSRLRALVAGLDEADLARPCPPEHPTLDGDWDVRQTVHHLADSHLNSYVRMRRILTEFRPLLAPWNQVTWAELPDARTAPLEPSLLLLEGLHARWAALLEATPAEAWDRVGVHPEQGELSLAHLVAVYARHCEGHLACLAQALEAPGRSA